MKVEKEMTIETAIKHIERMRYRLGLPNIQGEKFSPNAETIACDLAIEALREKAERENPQPLTQAGIAARASENKEAAENKVVKGYKVFNPDWTCRGFQYEVGKTYETEKALCCETGFHFCTEATDCFKYYQFTPKNKVAEIAAIGEIDKRGGDSKCCTNKIRIVRELSWHEVLDLVNTGRGCTGINNSGDNNRGHCNSGDCNSGHCNNGDCNSGSHNSGDGNSGNQNSGDYNSGDDNSGDWNSGSHNSGDWNIVSYATGCFNTENPKLLFFDKPTDMTFEEWRRSEACRLMSKINFNIWVFERDMTEEEKQQHPEYETTGGYLKELDRHKVCNDWWDGLSEEDKGVIKQIPNFDAEKFQKITGIDVRKKEAK